MSYAIDLFIDGKRVAGEGETEFVCRNPATGAEIGKFREASPAQIEESIASATRAQKVWAAMPAEERGRILRKAAQLLRARNDELARIEVEDTGKPIGEALAVDIQTGADAIEHYANLAGSLAGEYQDFGYGFYYTRREPIGVCAGIGAWNYPLQIACWKSAPALAAGNAMIFKPSELTPINAVHLAEIYIEAGMPPGVFNVLQGERNPGAALAAHPAVEKVSLTGSAPTGRKVMEAASPRLKEVSLELGGKSPLIIFEDADPEHAARLAMYANFLTQGEICANGTRVFIHSSIYDAVLDEIVKRTKSLKVGSPADPETQIGSLISMDHLGVVNGFVDRAREAGANVVCGGHRAEVPGHEHGAFYAPTVIADCTDDMEHVREEIFGPVMSVLKFETEDEVITRANQSDYGLAGGVVTKDLTRAHRIAANVQTGMFWINTYQAQPMQIPFGGYKQSGIGRENGWDVLDAYTQKKSVFVQMKPEELPF
ncbi:betaine-aldehyde dehydrogenase [Hyphomonas jannaschiana]|uniref:Betaine aldehyde dehydrogenase n=1 Tax=Hyphomonas jannaschiana VP2 TaxID=1280952 RepID=A0A059FGS3_9PROT|nr:betaine-aldehyde dehydrogenase [Hyphomonas jannaschiana]KCZ89840.1 betaine aldehyde dehydrogenase [Hyphomonas jannaschiana VP2]